MTKPYGRRHHRLRHQLLPLAYGTPCPRCGEIMLPGEDPNDWRTWLDLDHSDPLTKDIGLPGDRITHRRCNRRGLTIDSAPTSSTTSWRW
jgi:hypothetical protein